MNTVYWSLADDCAYWLCPGDLDAGCRELRTTIAELETWFLRTRLRWKQATVGAGAFFTTSALALVLQYYAAGISKIDTTACVVAFALAVWVATWKLPRLIQQLPINWVKHHPFNSPKIEKLRKYLNVLANSERPLTAKDGTPVARGILRQEWALLFLTSNAKLHALPIFSDIDIDLDSYPDGLFVERPTFSPAVVQSNNVSNVNFYVDQRSSPTTAYEKHENSEFQQHTHITTQAPQSTDRKQQSAPEQGQAQSLCDGALKWWPCSFEEDDFLIRLKIFAETTVFDKSIAKVGRIKSYQMSMYVMAIGESRRLWLADGTRAKQDVASEIATKMKKRFGWSGLSKKDSDSWIQAVISSTGAYKFVAEAFKAITYDPSEHNVDQYWILLH